MLFSEIACLPYQLNIDICSFKEEDKDYQSKADGTGHSHVALLDEAVIGTLPLT